MRFERKVGRSMSEEGFYRLSLINELRQFEAGDYVRMGKKILKVQYSTTTSIVVKELNFFQRVFYKLQTMWMKIIYRRIK